MLTLRGSNDGARLREGIIRGWGRWAIVSVAALALTACGGDGEDAQERVTANSEYPQCVHDSVPASWPSIAPVPATICTVTEQPQADGSMAWVLTGIGDNAGPHYVDLLAAEGWVVQEDFTDEGYLLLDYCTREDVTMTVSGHDNGADSLLAALENVDEAVLVMTVRSPADEAYSC